MVQALENIGGGGFKGPVKEIRHLFSKQVPVICADEFRTSKCCFLCGHELSHKEIKMQLKKLVTEV